VSYGYGYDFVATMPKNHFTRIGDLRLNLRSQERSSKEELEKALARASEIQQQYIGVFSPDFRPVLT